MQPAAPSNRQYNRKPKKSQRTGMKRTICKQLDGNHSFKSLSLQIIFFKLQKEARESLCDVGPAHTPCALRTWAPVLTQGTGGELYSASWGRNGGISEGSTESSQFTGLTYFKGGPGRAVAGSRCEEIVAAPTHHARLQDAAVRSPEQIRYRIQSPRVTYFTSDNEIRCWESFPEKYLVTDCSEMSV